jgi:pyruvate ferredoxin oxidoreductase alpha subunit
MAQRDTGWLQFYVESNQEALDTIIQAYRIAEQVLLPVMVNLDGFYLSHTAEVVDLPDQEQVDAFLPPFKPPYKIDVDDPHCFGAICLDSNFMRLRHLMQQAMDEARRVAVEVDAAFGEVMGRRYGVVEPYRLEGAETVLVTSGTITGTARVVVDQLREKGEPVGLLKIRMLRPFPFEALRELLGHIRRVAVIDRSVSFGLAGGLASEIRAALYDKDGDRPMVFGYIAGLGGQDVLPSDIEEIVRQTQTQARPAREDIWIGVRS